MLIKCIAIDDEPLALDIIAEYVSRFPTLILERTFDDPITGAEYLKLHPADLLFIDIQMPDISGIELVRSLTRDLMVIFTTAHKKFAAESYDLDAVDYLLKPIEFERFSKSVSKAIEYYQFKRLVKSQRTDLIFVRSEYQLVKILLNDIEYIESMEDYLKIHLSGSKPVMTLMTIKTIIEMLPKDKFIRIHRSYIIPVSKVRSISNKKVRITDLVLPISNSYAHVIDELTKKL